MRGYRYLDLILAAFVTVLIVSNIASTKILVLGPFTFDGGTILFPVAYIFGDVLTEVYGYSASRRVIWAGLAALAVTAGTLALVDALPAAPQWGWQEAFHAILGQTPRIVLGSLVAYWAGEFTNSFILARLKVATGGRWLWVRTLGSTMVGELVDTGVFLLVAFFGVLSADLLLAVLISNYVFKVGVEAVCTPLTYQAVDFLKRAEGSDVFDRDTDFNPFAVR